METIKNCISATTVVTYIVLLVVGLRNIIAINKIIRQRKTKITREKIINSMKLYKALLVVVFLLFICTFTLDMYYTGVTVSQRWGQALVIYVYYVPLAAVYFTVKYLLNKSSNKVPTAKASPDEKDGEDLPPDPYNIDTGKREHQL